MLAAHASQVKCEPLDRQQIDNRLKGCASLPSLGTIDGALKDLLGADQRYTSQIAEIIRRDPSLTARLLRLASSVYYGMTSPVKSVEEAVFYVGVRQIRQLAVVTTVVEDLQQLPGNQSFPWREFWQHCIAVALMTREIIDLVQTPTDETDYVAGLIHDVGKIVMASAFPDHFQEIYAHRADGTRDLLEVEKEVLGMNHAELGALYLRKQMLPEAFVEIVQFHHHPEGAQRHGRIAAAVQVSDMLVRHAKIGNGGNRTEPGDGSWATATGWNILFAQQSEEERVVTRASLKRSLSQIPIILEGLI